jgi:hypothetical protein
MGYENRQLWQILEARLQAVDFAGLAPKAKRWMAEIAGGDEGEIRLPVRSVVGQLGLRSRTRKKKERIRDARIPPPGTVISKKYKGNEYSVKVLESGFEYEGAYYRTLSAVANEITGSHWNGYAFFGLEGKEQ